MRSPCQANDEKRSPISSQQMWCDRPLAINKRRAIAPANDSQSRCDRSSTNDEKAIAPLHFNRLGAIAAANDSQSKRDRPGTNNEEVIALLCFNRSVAIAFHVRGNPRSLGTRLRHETQHFTAERSAIAPRVN